MRPTRSPVATARRAPAGRIRPVVSRAGRLADRYVAVAPSGQVGVPATGDLVEVAHFIDAVPHRGVAVGPAVRDGRDVVEHRLVTTRETGVLPEGGPGQIVDPERRRLPVAAGE